MRPRTLVGGSALVVAILVVAAFAILDDGQHGDRSRGAAPAVVDPTSFPRQFAPTSFWNASIPADVRFAEDRLPVGDAARPVNPTVGEELAAYARRPDGASNTWVNYEQYTSRIVVVGADQPLQPVKLCRDPQECVPSYAHGLDQMLRGVGADGASVGGGLPVPEDVPLPAAEDTDASIVFYQPDYVAPDGKRGRLYEAWQFRRNPEFDPRRPVDAENTRYTAAWGGRMVGVNGEGVGHYQDCFWSGCGHQADTTADPSAWGRPDSQAQDKGWGVTATSLPMTASQMSLADCVRGRLDHGIGIEVPYARAGTQWWPAQRNDGWADDKVVSEGMRLTFERGARPPAGLTRVGRAVWDSAYRHGIVIDDQSASSLNFRAEPGCERTPLFRDALRGGTENLMRGFPWGELRVIAQGSGETPNPTR